MESEKWKDEEFEERQHPLQKAAYELTIQLHHDIKAGEWLTESDPPEHPLYEVENGTMIASAKLAGALNRFGDEAEDWPPDKLSDGDILVRLKKAREALRDSRAGLDAADEQGLATPEWRSSTRAALRPILKGVEGLIAEVRDSLEN